MAASSSSSFESDAGCRRTLLRLATTFRITCAPLSAFADTLFEILKSDYVMIARLDGSERSLETIILYQDGRAVENVNYFLENTPCENALDGVPCNHPKNVQTLFPDDPKLTKWNIQAYVGRPILDYLGRAIGLVAVLNRTPLKDPAYVDDILAIICSPIARDLERVMADDRMLDRL